MSPPEMMQGAGQPTLAGPMPQQQMFQHPVSQCQPQPMMGGPPPGMNPGPGAYMPQQVAPGGFEPMMCNNSPNPMQPQPMHGGPPPGPAPIVNNAPPPRHMVPQAQVHGSMQPSFEQLYQMLTERQETIRAQMRDPSQTMHMAELEEQLVRNNQEMKQLMKQRQHSMYVQQQQNQIPPGAPQSFVSPGGPPVMQHGPNPAQPAPPPPHNYMDMGGMPGNMNMGPMQPQHTMMNKVQSIAAWQNQSYMLDSGINSSHSTAPPSLCSNGTGDLLDDDADSVYSSRASWTGTHTSAGYPQACYTPEQLDPYHNGPMSVGSGGVYYDSGNSSAGPQMCETPSYPSPQQFDPSQTPNAMQQRPPQQQFYPQQAQGPISKETITQVAMMLEENDPGIQFQAAEAAQLIAKTPDNRILMVHNSHIIPSLVNSLKSNDELLVKCAAGALHDLSQIKPSLLPIFKCGGIPALIGLLQSPREAVLFYAITTLHNLLMHQEGAKSAVAMSGGIPILVGLLKKNKNVKFLTISVDCLRVLGYNNQNNKEEILKSDGPAILLKLLTAYEYEKLLWTISRVLKVLSVCPQNKKAIVAAGGVHALAFHLKASETPGGGTQAAVSSRLVQNCLWTIRNLSDITAQNPNQSELLGKLIPYVKSGDGLMASCAVCIISNLLCNNVMNKQEFVRLNGIEALVCAIQNSHQQQVEELIEPAVCALRAVTSRHARVNDAQTQIRSGPGLHYIMMLMDQYSNSSSANISSASSTSSNSSNSSGSSKWPVLKAVIGLIRNLTNAPANMQDLFNAGVIGRLVGVIGSAQVDWQRRAATRQEYRVDGVKMEEIVEGAMTALHQIARAAAAPPNSPAVRRTIASTPNAINIFVPMLSSTSHGIVKLTLNLLTEVAVEPDGAEMIRATGNLQPLSSLMNSPDQQICDTAKLLFQRLTQQLPASVNFNSMNPSSVGSSVSANSEGDPGAMDQGAPPPPPPGPQPQPAHNPNPGVQPGGAPQWNPGDLGGGGGGGGILGGDLGNPFSSATVNSNFAFPIPGDYLGPNLENPFDTLDDFELDESFFG